MPIAIVIRDLGFGNGRLPLRCAAPLEQIKFQIVFHGPTDKSAVLTSPHPPQIFESLCPQALANSRMQWKQFVSYSLYPYPVYGFGQRNTGYIFDKKKNSGKYCALLTANLHSVTLIFILFFANQTYKITTVLLLSCKCTHFKYINFITYIFSTSVRNY